jgi:hypothetical protein
MCLARIGRNPGSQSRRIGLRTKTSVSFIEARVVGVPAYYSGAADMKWKCAGGPSFGVSRKKTDVDQRLIFSAPLDRLTGQMDLELAKQVDSCGFRRAGMGVTSLSPQQTAVRANHNGVLG